MLTYLLDTNIVIYVIKQKPMGLRDTFNQHAARTAISSITLAELLFGVEKSSNPSRNLMEVDAFCSRLTVLSYGAKAAAHYGSIRAKLEQRGMTIGGNDMHIAAHARSEGLTLVSNNLREFERVPGMLMENWISDAVR